MSDKTRDDAFSDKDDPQLVRLIAPLSKRSLRYMVYDHMAAEKKKNTPRPTVKRESRKARGGAA